MFKRYLKSVPTDRRTFQLKESIGPEGRCFENLLLNFKYSSSDNFLFLTTPKQKLNFAHTLYMAQIEGKY